MVIKSVVVSEKELWRFIEFCEELFTSDTQIKRDGVCKLILDDSCKGTGSKFEDMVESLKNLVCASEEKVQLLSVLRHPDFPGVYAHKSRPVISDTSCVEELLNSNAFSVNSNCCSTFSEKNDEEGLLNHFFEETLHLISEDYPSYAKLTDMNTLRRSTMEKVNKLKACQNEIQASETFQEKASLASDFLLCSVVNKKGEMCMCDMCVVDDTLEIVPQSKSGRMTENMMREGALYGAALSVPMGGFRMTRNFSLSFVSLMGLLPALESSYPGITSPCCYLGTKHSFFPCHIEDLSLLNVNYLHYGSPKLWIVVPPSSVSKLDFHLSRTKLNGFHYNCRNNLGHKYHVPTVKWLQEKDIPFSAVLQGPGESVVLGPNAAHFGFNLGTNIAEAINFTTRFWIPYGIMAPLCSCLYDAAHPDLSFIIHDVKPEYLAAYRNKTLPVVPEDPDFLNCLVQFALPPSAQQTSFSEAEEPCISENNGKRRVQRKTIQCPICNLGYSGGHKDRLLKHIRKRHSNLSGEEQSKVDDALALMFPDWGSKLKKRSCQFCGKMIAGSLHSHQQSKSCKYIERVNSSS